MIRKRFRCDAPFELVAIDFYKYSATLLLCRTPLNNPTSELQRFSSKCRLKSKK